MTRWECLVCYCPTYSQNPSGTLLMDYDALHEEVSLLGLCWSFVQQQGGGLVVLEQLLSVYSLKADSCIKAVKPCALAT